MYKINKEHLFKNDLSDHFSIWNNRNDKLIFDEILDKIDTIVVFESYEKHEEYKSEFGNNEDVKILDKTKEIKEVIFKRLRECNDYDRDVKTIFKTEYICFFKFEKYEIYYDFFRKFNLVNGVYSTLREKKCKCC